MAYIRKNKNFTPKLREVQICWFYEELSGVWFRSPLPRVRKALYLSEKTLIQTGFISLREVYKNLGILDFIEATDLGYDLYEDDMFNILGWGIDSGWSRSLLYSLKPTFDENELHPLYISIEFGSVPEWLCKVDYEELGFRELYNELKDAYEPVEDISESCFIKTVNTRNYIFRRKSYENV